MSDGNLVGTLDIAEMAFWAFVAFFIALVFYLRREDRREGYPLEDELSGASETPGGVLSRADNKVFKLPHGKGLVTAPTGMRDPVDIQGRRRERFHGAPYSPVGNPLAAGVGPGAYAQRARWPDLDALGQPRIVPIDAAEGFSIAPGSIDPRGLPVIGADGRQAGVVSNIWVDRSDHLVRYLVVDTGAGEVLAPMGMAVVRRNRIIIDAIEAASFAGAPQPANPGEISLYEEDKIVGYFGAGYLYANAERAEPLI